MIVSIVFYYLRVFKMYFEKENVIGPHVDKQSVSLPFLIHGTSKAGPLWLCLVTKASKKAREDLF